MNMQYKKGVFEEKCGEYWKARKKRKSVILSSLVEVTGLTRKDCIKRMRFLQLKDPCGTEQRGRPRYYTPDVIVALLEVWEIGSESCGENLHSQINEYVDIQIREKKWKHDELVTYKLRKMSEGSVKHMSVILLAQEGILEVKVPLKKVVSFPWYLFVWMGGIQRKLE